MAKTRGNVEHVEVKPLNMVEMNLEIRGFEGPLVVHNWGAKAIREMLEKQMCKKKSTKGKEPKDPDAQYLSTLYTFEREGKTRYGFPASGFKKALVRTVKLLKDTKQLDLDMIMAKQILFVLPDGTEDREFKIPLEDGTVMSHNVRTELVEIRGVPQKRMDMVRIGMGTADIRFRAEFPTWGATLRMQYNADVLDATTVSNLVYRAGMTVGIGEGRPEKGDQGWGRFEIC